MCLRIRGSVAPMRRFGDARLARALPLALAGVFLLGLYGIGALSQQPAARDEHAADAAAIAPDPNAPPPELSQGSILVGELIYKEQCASCHGANLEGQPNWKTPGADGKYPAPPHDDSGHTWHHPDDVLVKIILDGGNGNPGAPSNMPAFRGKLTPIQLEGLLSYFKSKWSPEHRAYQWRMTASGGGFENAGPP